MASSYPSLLLSLAGLASAQYSSLFAGLFSVPASYYPASYSYGFGYGYSTPAYYPSATASYAAPLPTFVPEEGGSGSQSDPCGAIGSIVADSTDADVLVDSELALSCLQSVPIDKSLAASTINSILKMLEFQSTLEYIANPPDGYPYPAVDLKQEISDIGDKVSNGDYDNEYDFEVDIYKTMGKAHEGHLTWRGYAARGALLFVRDWECALVSVSMDGGPPKVYLKTDVVNDAGSASAITEINGEDVIDFLNKEADTQSYQDPDANWNTLFYSEIPRESGEGAFVWPSFYPGANTTFKFENGNTKTFKTAAFISPSYLEYWADIDSAQDFFTTFIEASSSSNKRSVSGISKRGVKTEFKRRSAADLEKRVVPPSYPDPFISHSGSMNVAGFFFDHPTVGNLGVLMCGTFAAEPSGIDDGDAEAQEFQKLLEDYFSEATSRGVEKLVIDLRQNGGGSLFLGYEMFAQLFPDTEPYGASRYRAHDAADLFGQEYSTVPYTRNTGDVYSTPFSYNSWLDTDLADWESWDDMYGPISSGDGKFTKTLRYNLSNPLLTSSERYSLGVTITGTGDRTGFKQPFDADNIILLYDGDCASTCALFTEMMVHQQSVRTFAVGGRPQVGPMQAVGGTKGSRLLDYEYLTALSDYLLSTIATSNSEAQQWADIVPDLFAINAASASVNFQDQVRETDADEVPLQFVNETSNCRLWYDADSYFDPTALWDQVATIAWGNNGGLNESACISGSARANNDDQGAGSMLRPSAVLMAIVGAAVVLLM